MLPCIPQSPPLPGLWPQGSPTDRLHPPVLLTIFSLIIAIVVLRVELHVAAFGQYVVVKDSRRCNLSHRSRCSWSCLSPSPAGWSATGRRTVPHTRGASTAVSALGLESCCTDSTDSIDSTRTSRSRGEEDVGSCRRSSGPASKRRRFSRRLSRRLSRRWFRRGWCRRGWCRRLA